MYLVKTRRQAVKKLKHIILAIIIIFNCLILSGLFFIFILINKDDDKTKGIKFAVQNEYQTQAGEGTKYEIIDGKLYGCGWNEWGQLGIGTVENVDVVYEESILIADSVVHVDTCNNGTTVFLNDKGELYGIGNNISGQLGVPIGETERYNREERFVTTPTRITDNVKYAVVGSDYIVILKQDGNLYVMGDDNKGQLGDGPAESNVEGHYIYGYTPFSYELKHVMGGVSYIACGGCTIAAIKNNGELWMWGDNTYGQVGNKIVGPNGASTTNFSVTKPYLTMEQVKNVRFEGEFETTVFAETLSDETYIWGEGYSAVPVKLEDSNQKEDMEIYAQRVPLEEEVYAMRKKVLEGMSEEEISRLKENIRIANLQLEYAYFNENIFEELSDPKSLYWNYFDEKGSIQLGWYLRDVPEYDISSDMSYSEYMEKYGEPSRVYNRFDAVNFIELMEEMKASLKNDWLKPDFEQLIEYTRLAKETHDVIYAENIYYILHDIDYFLLRYGLSEVKGVSDPGTLQKYYHILEIYKNHIDELEITPAYLGEYTINEIVGRSKISGMSDEEAEKFVGGYLRISPSQMFIIGDYVGSTDVSGYIDNVITKNEFEEMYQVSAKNLMPLRDEIVQVSAEVVERSNRNYSLTTFFILDEDTILLTQDGIFLKAIRKK